MAGSYGHVSLQDGAFSTIENLGDAYETVEELLYALVYVVRENLRLRQYPEPTTQEIHEEIERVVARFYGDQPPHDIIEIVTTVMER